MKDKPSSCLKKTEIILRSSKKNKKNTLKKGKISFKTFLKNCCGYKCEKIDVIQEHLPLYQCKKFLGEGGFGATFLFEDPKGSQVALKVIEGLDKSSIDNEKKILKALKNSCAKRRVLCYNKVFCVDKSTFFVTEYIKGKNLEDYIIKNHKDLYSIIGQLIDAVEYIHSKNIVHFDIKPENIMITDKGDVKLIDFGGASLKNIWNIVSLGAYTAYYAPEGTKDMSTYMKFKSGKYFDFYTVMTTFIQLLRPMYNVPNDLVYLSIMKKPDLSFDSSIMNHINRLKKVVDSHIDSKSKSFIENNFNHNSRKLIKNKIS